MEMKCHYICQRGCSIYNLYDQPLKDPNEIRVCAKCEQPMSRQDFEATYYTFYCQDQDCSGKREKIPYSIDGLPRDLKCPKCKGPMETETERDQRFDNSVGVSFRGFTTPGGNGSPNFKKLPSEIQGWAKKRYDQDRALNEQAKKPVQWPDGTVR